MRKFLIPCAALLVASFHPWAAALADGPVRVGVLKFGSVQWELDVMRRHQIDVGHGFTVETVELASKDAAPVALQGGAVDIILTDWLWVARRRVSGGDYTFVPHSRTNGGVMVAVASGIKSIADFKGRRIGVGGGPVDKSWLILRAYAKKTAGLDLTRDAEPVFAAPPLLNETLKNGGIPGAINFWNYNARLPADQFTELLRIEDILPALDLPADVPLLGWVFSAKWAEHNKATLQGFLAAADDAGRLLAHSDEEWERIAPFTGAKDAKTLASLREGYRRGLGQGKTADAAAAAQKLLDLLIEFREFDEAPPDGRIPTGTFYGNPG